MWPSAILLTGMRLPYMYPANGGYRQDEFKVRAPSPGSHPY